MSDLSDKTRQATLFTKKCQSLFLGVLDCGWETLHKLNLSPVFVLDACGSARCHCEGDMEH